MGKEEQQEEREVLDSIFPDEITGTFELEKDSKILERLTSQPDVSETEYRVQIQLDVTQADDDDTPARKLLRTFPSQHH